MLLIRKIKNKPIDLIKIKKKLLAKEEKKFSAVPTPAAFFQRKDVLDRVYLELMKLSEMHSLEDGNNVKHWVDKIVANLAKSGVHYPLSVIFSVPCGRSFDELVKYVGANEIRLMKDEYGTPDGFIDSIRTRMLTESKYDGPKYEAWFRIHGTQIDNEKYRILLKALSLYFSGQLTEEDCDDFWNKDVQRIIHSSKINFKKKLPWSESDMKHNIKIVLSGFTCIDYKNK